MRVTKIERLEYKFWSFISSIDILEGTKIHTKAKLKKALFEMKAFVIIWDKAKELGVDIW